MIKSEAYFIFCLNTWWISSSWFIQTKVEEKQEEKTDDHVNPQDFHNFNVS